MCARGSANNLGVFFFSVFFFLSSGLSESELQRTRGLRRGELYLQERLERRELRRDGQGRLAVSAGLF